MANKYRGEVEFTNPAEDGKTYVLRLGTNEFIQIQSELAKLDGVEWQRAIFHHALVKARPEQAEMTVEDAGELIDDIGHEQTDALIKQTRWGVMTTDALAKAEAAALKRKQEDAQKNGANPPETATPSNG